MKSPIMDHSPDRFSRKIIDRSSTTYELMDITPSVAEEFLQHNQDNRKIRRYIVARYISMLKNGKWIANGDTFRFSESGRLIDGQHRLTAISMSGTTLNDQLVVRNLPEKAYNTIDDGAMRSPADIGAAQNWKQARSVMSLGKWLIACDLGINFSTQHSSVVDKDSLRNITKNDIVDYIVDNNLIEGMYEAIRLAGLAVDSVKGSKTAWAYTIYKINAAYGSEVCDEFLNGVINGIGISHINDPRTTLRKYMTKHVAVTGVQMKMPPQIVAMLTAFNYWIHGKSLQRLIFSWDMPEVGQAPQGKAKDLPTDD